MATLTENFDSYSNGANLGTLNGGTGWTGAWTKGANASDAAFTVSNAQSISSPNSAAFSTSVITGVDSSTWGRPFTSVSAGTFYVSWFVGASPTNIRDVVLADASGGNKIIIQRNNTGSKFQYYNGAGYTDLFTWTANTWYRIGIQWDNAGHANQARYNASSNGGTEGDLAAWTAYTNVNGNFASVGFLSLYNPVTQTNSDYIDNISDTYIFPTATNNAFLAFM